MKKHNNSISTVSIFLAVITGIFLFWELSFAVIDQNNAAKDDNKPCYVPGEIIIKFKEDVSEIALDVAEGRKSFKSVSKTEKLGKLNAKYKVKKIERIIKGLRGIKNRRGFLEHVKGMRAKHVREKMGKPREDKIPDLHNIYLLKVNKDTDVEAICDEYKQDPNVEYAEPNYIAYTAETFPNDPDFSQQWGLHNTSQTGGTVDADIDGPEAWDSETGDPDVVIAVVDTGVDWDHPDLADSIWINPGEDINHNGIVDEEDFNEADDDGNGFIDDVRGWDFVTVVESCG